MTEYERIIAEGRIPISFLEPQTICDTYVDVQLKKIWAIEIDLLLEFDKVCRNHYLKYYAFGGTILGAVRHKGFIPWDDDIDVAMPMDDYLKLQEFAGEFSHPYYLQTPFLDPGSYFSFMKLRNSETTFMSKVFSAQRFNQGAFIDIFPLVECPPEQMKAQRAKIYPSIMRCSNYMKRGCEDLLNSQQMARMKEFSTDNPLSEYEKILKEFNNPAYKGCGYYTHASLFFNYDEYHIWSTKLWDGVVNRAFEFTNVPLPIGWDAILTEYYGAYMTFPPIEKRVSLHSDMIIDMDKPYTAYLR